MNNHQKGFVKIILIIVVLALVGVGAYFLSTRNTAPLSEQTCPQDTMTCPDGSSVGRIGPDCSFAACSTPSPTCIQRPSCLDATPRCLIAEPASGWCPKPQPTPTGEKITVKVGEREGSFLVQKINSDSVDGLSYQRYPVATMNGTPKTLHIGDDIGQACEGVSEKLTSISVSGQTVTFTKAVGKAPLGGCPK